MQSEAQAAEATCCSTATGRIDGVLDEMVDAARQRRVRLWKDFIAALEGIGAGGTARRGSPAPTSICATPASTTASTTATAPTSANGRWRMCRC